MKKYLLLLSLVLCLSAATTMAQNGCPGFHNPVNFNSTAGSAGSWSARVGDRVHGSSGSTGYNVLSTCARPNKTPIKGNTNITSSDYYSGYCQHRCGSCNQCTLFDGHDQRFRIYTMADQGLDQFTINNGVGMNRIPAGHLTSIRLGDMRATGQCVSNINSDGNNKGAEALFYTMRVNAQNSLLFIDYAIVACRYTHTPAEAGEFLIRVCGKNSSTGQWNNFPLNDSLWFNVPAPAIGGTLPAPWVEGLPGGPSGATTCGYCYKPWTRVAISLINYIYDSVRVEMYTSDCVYDVDPIYAYIAGACQPMQITTSGCPAGESNAVDTLRAPEGLLTYTWYVSETGYSGTTSNTEYMNSLPFRQVRATSTNNMYVATIDDFIVTQGENAGDTVGVQTYKCIMTSAMDPEKPFHSVVYATVSNTKPVIKAKLTPNCDSTVTLEAQGHIPYQGVGAPLLLDSLTVWTIYEGSTDDTPILDTVQGKYASYKFSDEERHAVKLTMYTEDSTCYTSKTYIVRPTLPPDIHIDIDKRTLCIGDSSTVSEDATITDLTQNVRNRRWVFQDATYDNVTSITRHFTEFENPFMLIVTSNNENECVDTLYDTIYFFHDPEITFSNDTIVCNGHEAHVTASTPVSGCQFAWFRHKNQPGETPICEGNTLYVRPTQPRSRYYLRITANAGCVAWDSVDLSLISTKITAIPSSAKHCPGDTVTLIGSGALRYEWTSYPPDPDLDRQAQNDTIRVSPNEDTRYYMVGYAADDCDVAAINILVKYIPLPIVNLEYSPRYIDTEVPVVNFTDLSENRDHTRWLFGDGSTSTGQMVTHHFDIYMPNSNTVTMQSFNEMGCNIDTTVTIPIDTFGFYRPNIFTPNKSTNNRFFIVCPSNMDKFHIAIFDRRGALVFSSDDQHFQWDGTHNGTPMPQDAYPYIITYTREGNISEFKLSGTVTLIR
ncbi:MAG: gliding motility-associated C-terminal domain-containing protein [Bacteroidales bacterium]|nr:gliding motility-associated C-terminal domain-containing protein [Bacteroidales bacterium]